MKKHLIGLAVVVLVTSLGLAQSGQCYYPFAGYRHHECHPLRQLIREIVSPVTYGAPTCCSPMYTPTVYSNGVYNPYTYAQPYSYVQPYNYYTPTVYTPTVYAQPMYSQPIYSSPIYAPTVRSYYAVPRAVSPAVFRGSWHRCR